jgi:hypothetical protein
MTPSKEPFRKLPSNIQTPLDFFESSSKHGGLLSFSGGQDWTEKPKRILAETPCSEEKLQPGSTWMIGTATSNPTSVQATGLSTSRPANATSIRPLAPAERLLQALVAGCPWQRLQAFFTCIVSGQDPAWSDLLVSSFDAV